MSEINSSASSEDQKMSSNGKIPRARKPKIERAPGSFRFGTQSVASTATYGPCAFEVTIATHNVIGADVEAEKIQAFCRGFADHTDLCVINGYGVFAGSWKVIFDLNTGGKDVNDTFVSTMFLQMKQHFEATPVLKADFGAGKASYRFLNGGTTVEAGSLN